MRHLNLVNKIQYPVIIKATAGGGGKGIRVAKNEQELIKGINITQQEALTAFGNPGVYIEKYVEDFRHVEIQVLADSFGNTIHLGERDCSIQRRLQKLLRRNSFTCVRWRNSRRNGKCCSKSCKSS